MKLRGLRIWGLAAFGVALSCGKSRSTAGDHRGPAGAGGTASGAGAISGAGPLAEGGAGTGGGDAGAPPLTDCMPGEPTQGEFCTLSLHCAEQRLLGVRCSEPPPVGGPSFCTCSSDAASDPSFEVTGLSGALLCEAAADYCLAPDLPEECSWTVESREPKSCELERNCVKTLANAGGVDASVNRRSGARCEDYGDGRMTCDCLDGRRFIVNGQTGMEVCDTMFPLCAGESPLVFDGEIACTTGSGSGSSGVCESHPICERAEDLGDGVTVLDRREFDLVCEDKSSGGSACTCVTGGTNRGYFDLESPTEGSATCARFAPLCGLAEPIALTSEIECALEYQGVFGESCFVQLKCGQPATFDGEQILVYGTTWADCARDGDAYVCSCALVDDSAPLEIEASSSWDACTAAATRCRDVVPVKIGDGVIRPPVPPPVGH